MAIKITLNNTKGGVSKTATVVNFGTVLAELGYKVLIIDNDGQASLTLSLGYNPIDCTTTMSDVYYNDKPISKVIMETDIERLYLAPSNTKLTIADTKLSGTPAKELILSEALEEIADDYDYILIDNNPIIGIASINALIASDYILIPCQTSPLATYALDDLFDAMNSINIYRKRYKKKPIKSLGVLPTLFKANSNSNKKQLEELQKERNGFTNYISNAAAVENAIDAGIPVVIHNRKATVSNQYRKAVEEMIERIKEK